MVTPNLPTHECSARRSTTSCSTVRINDPFQYGAQIAYFTEEHRGVPLSIDFETNKRLYLENDELTPAPHLTAVAEKIKNSIVRYRKQIAE